ncbi:MAG: hypothetical protein SynsKO_43230 [Synoicihabitans sp.]
MPRILQLIVCFSLLAANLDPPAIVAEFRTHFLTVNRTVEEAKAFFAERSNQ